MDHRGQTDPWTATRNATPDRRADAAFVSAGRRVIGAWEHDDPEDVVRWVARALASNSG